MRAKDIRNIAIIAHVDHGKTTLIDSIFRQSGMIRDNQKLGERIMDRGDLERERGITILAKCTAIEWGGAKINIIDTPGHADFGGEVERVLDMADGAILLVDAAEGPLPQTRFVLGKALKLGLCPIVIINKIDRPDARAGEVHNEIFDLFSALDASEEQLDFPTLYASGRDGWCVRDLAGDKRENLHPLLETVLQHVPPPSCESDAPFRMLATLLEADPYLGRVLTGKVYSGKAKVNMPVKALNLSGKTVENFRLTKLLTFSGIERVPASEVVAGDIVCIAGMKETSVADTICATDVATPVSTQPVDPPTMAVTITVNDSPLAGREGKKLTSTMIGARLKAEAETNVAIRVTESAGHDSFELAGRGELQLGVLIETMRREGFELSVSRPRVLFREENGQKLEPYEEVVIDVDDGHTGVVIDQLARRKAEMIDMRPSGGGKTRLTFIAPSRGLIGYQGQFLTDTRGSGVMNRLFHAYGAYKGDVPGRRNGALVSTDIGAAVAYAIFNLQDRGVMFIEHQTPVYQGMIVGENSRENDLDINVLKGKKLTNIRAAGSDENIILVPPRRMSLEEMMSWINEDELVEVTPKSLRLRKKRLTPHSRELAKKALRKEVL